MQRPSSVKQVLILTLTIAMTLPSRSFAGVDGIPSDSYDDYDQPKYSKQLSDSVDQYNKAKASSDQATNEYNSAVQSLNQARNALADTLRRLDEAQRDESSTMRQLETNARELEDLARFIQQKQYDVNQLQGAYNDEARRTEILDRRKKEVARALGDSKAQMDLVVATETSARNSYNQKNTVSSANSAAVAALVTKIANASVQKTNAQAAKSSLESQLVTLQTQRQGVADDLNLKTNYKATLVQQLAAAQAAQNQALIDSTNAEIAKVDAALSVAQKNLNQVDDQISKQQSAIQSKAQEIAQIDSQNSADQAQLVQKQSAQAALDADTAQAKKVLDTAVVASQGAKAAYDKIKDESDKTTAEYNRSFEISRSLQSRLGDETIKLNGMINRQRDVSRQTEQLNSWLIQARQGIAQLISQRDAYSNSVAQWEDYTRRKDSDRNAALANTQRADQDRNQKQARLSQVQNNIDSARNAMKSVAGSHGTQDGTREGQEFGQSNGRRDGQARGTEQGRNEGLQASYNQGKNEGLAHGAQTGDDHVAYAKGRSHGEADGLDTADQEAQAQEVIGYKVKETEFRTAFLKPIIVDQSSTNVNSVIKSMNKGFQESHAGGIGDGRYYQPRPSQYPHPLITQFYNQFYDEAYRASITPTYNRVYADEFEVARKDYRQRTFDQFKNDRGQHDRGFADGNAIASEQKGYNEGKAAAYAANIGPLKTKYFEKGKAAANDLYTNNAVLEVVSSQIYETDKDGIYRPGESVALELKVKNYGLVPARNSKTMIATQSGSTLVIANPEMTVNDLAPQSEAIVRGVGVAQISENTLEQADLKLGLKFIDPKGKNIYQNNLAAKAAYPVGTSVQGFSGILVPGVNTALKIAVQNRSQKAQVLVLKLSVDSSKVDTDTKTQTINLEAGASGSVQFMLTGRPEANFESAPLAIGVSQNDLKFANDVNVASTVIKKHQKNPGSVGLLLSGDFSKGGGKQIFANAPVDTWDLRVDGQLTQNSDANAYMARMIHILAEPSLKLDPSAVANLLAFVQKGGSLVIWGTDLNAVSGLSQVLGVKSGATININEPINGANQFRGLGFNLNSVVSVPTATSPKTISLLTGSRDIVATGYHQLEFQDGIGRIIVIGAGAQDVDATTIKSIIQRVTLWRKPFNEKMDLAMQNPQYLSSVIEDLMEEIRDDMYRKDVNWMKDNRKSTKIYRATEMFLGKNSKIKNNYALMYPTMVDFSNKLGDFNQSSYVEIELQKHTVGGAWSSPSWRSAYCATKESRSHADLCPSPGGGGTGDNGPFPGH